ncbi:MAG TPA: hypothetical protein VLL05_13065 [Terriglobales bacterium]|nr:hypothetical protein [Terriglobales bacterium]
MVELAFLFLLALASFAQSNSPPKVVAFHAAEYPTGKFQISRRELPLGEVTVRVIQVKNLGYTMLPDTCRAWLEVRKGERLPKRFYYADIEPVGFSFGIFLPKRQPTEDYFVAVKEGDYDGRLLLVRKDGETQDLPGGFFFVTSDRRFLVSEYSSDLYALAVFDLKENRKVLESRDLPEIGSWYQDDSGYFFMEYGKPGQAERLDLEKGQLTKMHVKPADLSRAHKVHYDFDPRNTRDCTSEPQ